MKTCAVVGCKEALSNSTHQFCLNHWRMDKDGKLRQTEQGQWIVAGASPPPVATKAPSRPERDSDSSGPGLLSSTKLGQHFDLSATRVNLILAELGWIEKYIKGWTPTDQGKALGAQLREVRQSGVPYVVWPESILDNRILKAAATESTGGGEAPSTEAPSATTPEAPATSDFRERFPAQFRATDGHMVRSRAEMLIDNWLYMQGVVHAFERKLPIEEEVYCDFYLPKNKVYIEYWGMENDPKYAARMRAKKEIYERYKLNLVELSDDHIMNLDDVLPRMLLKFGIDCT